MDHPREVVFQKAFPKRREVDDHLFVVHRVGPDEAEVDEVLALAGARGQSPQTVAHRAVFLFREGLGIDRFQSQLAPCLPPILLEQTEHPRRVGVDARRLGGEAPGVVETHGDRLVEARQRRPSALGQGVDPAFGEIDARRGEERPAQGVDREEQHQGEDDTAGSGQACGHLVPLHGGHDRLKINHLSAALVSSAPSLPVIVSMQRY